MNKKKYFFVVLNSFFIAGILFSRYVNFDILLLLILFFVCFVFSFLFRSDVLCSVFLYCLMLIFGALYVRNQKYVCRYSSLLNGVEGYVCISQKMMKLCRKFNSVEFLVVKVKCGGKWEDVDDILKVQLIINSENVDGLVIFYGDTFLVESGPSMIVKKSFDRRSVGFYNYFTSNGVYYNHFLSFREMKFLGSNPLSLFKYFFEKVRFRLKESAFCRIFDVSTRVILSNLLFGKVDVIDSSLRRAYISMGIIHILAISGLHIGLLFVIISFLLSLLNINRSVVDVVSLVIIWFYGFLVMMPVSVLRAILMISFYKVNDLFDRSQPRYTFIFNSLVCSLIVNPVCIYSVGFQLSYLATFGILFLASDLHRFFRKVMWFFVGYLPFGVDRLILSSISVFISVELFTIPVILYNFQCFNVLSFVSNILIVPIVPVVLFLGVLLILFSPVPLIHLFVSRVVECIVSCINCCILCGSRVEGFEIRVDDFWNGVFVYYVILFIALIVFKNIVSGENKY